MTIKSFLITYLSAHDDTGTSLNTDWKQQFATFKSILAEENMSDVKLSKFLRQLNSIGEYL